MNVENDLSAVAVDTGNVVRMHRRAFTFGKKSPLQATKESMAECGRCSLDTILLSAQKNFSPKFRGGLNP